MAHGRSGEIHSKSIERTVDNYHGAYGEPLMTDWEKLIQTAGFASRAREDVRVVLEAIHGARLDKKEYLFTFGMGISGASIVPE